MRLVKNETAVLDMFIPLLVAYCFIEPASGILHVVLDNEKFNTWPILGDVAASFQRHHHNPYEISQRPTATFALEPTLPYAVIAVQSLWIRSDFTIAVIVMLYPMTVM